MAPGQVLGLALGQVLGLALGEVPKRIVELPSILRFQQSLLLVILWEELLRWRP